MRSWGILAVGLAAVLAGIGLGSSPFDAWADPAPLARSPDGRPMVLTFGESFDRLRTPWGGGRPNDHVWRTTYGDGAHSDVSSRTLKGNKEVQLYVDPTMTDGQGRSLGLNPFAVHDGVLDIVADRTKPQNLAGLSGYGFTSGLISSQPSFSQLYGYFEARLKLPEGKGLWPAFWMLPADLSWPPEIDVMESIGDPKTAFMSVHSAMMKTQGVEVHASSAGFHTYAVAWDEKKVIFFLDGVEEGRAQTPADMHKPMYVLANLAMGGDWAGTPTPVTPFPAKFSIDYIRIYRFAS